MFCPMVPEQGTAKGTALLSQLILPKNGDRLVKGNVSFFPCYFERAIHEALKINAGIAFLHSHPAPGWQNMSPDDIRAEKKIAASIKAATGLPLVGLTLGIDHAWSARFWIKTKPKTYKRYWCKNVRVVGKKLTITYMEKLCPRPQFRKELTRTISAWGEGIQADLARLKIGIVGVGSVGSIVAEALARMGINHLLLLDFDVVKDINLDRLLHATRKDALLRRSKVSVLARALRKSATADKFVIDKVERSIADEEGYRAALDCDVLFSCVDRPLGRSILNFIAYAHLIPVVDGGVRIETTKQGNLKRADWRAHIASPERRCLECLKQYDPSLVQLEREGYLDDPKYIEGLVNNPLLGNENVFAFSLNAAGLEVLQMLMMIIAPLGISEAGEQLYHFVPGSLDTIYKSCENNCPYPRLIAKGDTVTFTVTNPSRPAE
jgi:molybdopterin-synthase adenylyltransferase